MTYEEMKVKCWLKRAFYAEKKIHVLEMLLKTLRMRAEGLDGTRQYNHTGRSDTVSNGTENAFLKIADIERRLTGQKKELFKVTEEIAEAIELLHDDELETVLMHRYLMFHTIEETAEIMHYSVRTVNYKQDEAVRKLCTLLHCIAR